MTGSYPTEEVVVQQFIESQEAKAQKKLIKNSTMVQIKSSLKIAYLQGMLAAAKKQLAEFI